ncbi:MAG: protoheme IX farnesyltransferase [Nitrospirota bacterium]
MKTVTAYFNLCRLPISLFATCSSLTGYVLTGSTSVWPAVLLAAGVFLLACGASALNQFQDRDLDAMMERTCLRPLPAGAMTSVHVLVASVVLILSGLLLLAALGWTSVMFGSLALLWYNGLYTPLKRMTAFAAVPGALVGALPPVMGWLAGGGHIADPRIFALAMLFFLWQIPHFWLLLLRNAAQYEQAGLPTLTSIIPQELLARITLLWIAAAAVASLAMPLFGIVRSPFAYAFLVIMAVWISGSGFGIIIQDTAATALRPAFRRVNIFILLFMLLAVFDSFLSRG